MDKVTDAIHFTIGQDTQYEAVVHLTEVGDEWHGHIMFKDPKFTPSHQRNTPLRFKWWILPIGDKQMAEIRARNYYEGLVSVFKGLQREAQS